jgi:hypothetical protein
MSGPYTVRIVLAPGTVRELGGKSGWGGARLSLREKGTHYKTVANARRAAKKYIGDGKALGSFYADIQDENDPERHIDIDAGMR